MLCKEYFTKISNHCQNIYIKSFKWKQFLRLPKQNQATIEKTNKQKLYLKLTNFNWINLNFNKKAIRISGWGGGVPTYFQNSVLPHICHIVHFPRHPPHGHEHFCSNNVLRLDFPGHPPPLWTEGQKRWKHNLRDTWYAGGNEVTSI